MFLLMIVISIIRGIRIRLRRYRTRIRLIFILKLC